MSFIPDRFRVRGYRGAQDWATDFINEQVLVGGKVDINKLRVLARMNGVDTSKLDPAIDDGEQHIVGRARMTWGNSLRAVARKNGGLKDVLGVFRAADADFIANIPVKEPAVIDDEKVAKRKANFEKMQAAARAKRAANKAAKAV